MKWFFIVVLLIYTAINTYIYIRGYQAIPVGSWRAVYTTIFLFIAASYIVGELLEHNAPSIISTVLVWIGAFWFAFFVYFFLSAVFIDFFRLLDHWLHFFPEGFRSHPQQTRSIVTLVVVIIVTVAIFFGFLNARNPRLRSVSFTIEKSLPGHEYLHIVGLSDLHLGSIVSRSMLTKMVAKINSAHPDIVLMAGDIIDGNLQPAIDAKLGDLLKQIKSKYGVYAITGNHEYIGNANKSCEYLEANGVHLVRDTAVEVAGLYLVGREDRSAPRSLGHPRKPLEELVHTLDTSKPILMMDHQPFHLEEAEQNHIDFQFSGHTHHAQMWPFQFITEWVYEVSWGYKRKGNTNVYVSSGAGTWGPPVRIGNTPEIVDFTVHFLSSEIQ